MTRQPGMTQRILRVLLILLTACAFPVVASAALMVNELMSSNLDVIADEDGAFEDWIEILNTGPDTLDLAGYALSDDTFNPQRWLFPTRVLLPNERLLVFASGKDRAGAELHTNFSLSATGEILLFSDPGGSLVDLVAPTFLPVNVSLGRSPDGGASGYLFSPSTPDSANDGPAYTGIAAAPVIDPPGGFHAGGVTASISDTTGLADGITWTLGGWDPGPDSTLYTAPIGVAATAVLRARAFETGKLPSPIATASYLVDEGSVLPRVSVVTDPDNLWDDEIGIYVLGNDYDPHSPYYGANFWQDWERPAHLEYFDETGALLTALDLGVKIHGNMSRVKPQKSLRLVMRGGYGAGAIQVPLFASEGLALSEFNRLILRNASNDWCIAHMRDGLAQSAVRHLDLDCQGYVPTQVFLNGEYWGVHNLREYLKQQYLVGHHDVDADGVDILEEQGIGDGLIWGDNAHYLALVDFLEINSLADSANYAWVTQQMEVENFATYNISEIFFGNIDWPRNNRRFWRPRAPGGRWRWFMIDLDYASGMQEGPEYDYLDRATHPTGTSSQNPPWATLMIRSLLDNDGFRRDFINRYLDHLNSTFTAERMVGRVLDNAALLDPEMERHQTRWEASYLGWQNDVDDLVDFFTARPAHAREHIKNKFALGDTLTLTLDVQPPGSGQVTLTALTVDSLWSGLYLQGNPIDLHAAPLPGWAFSGWSTGESEDTLSISPSVATQLTANFIPVSGPSPRIVINEINYNSSPVFDPGDWVELVNAGEGEADLNGWEFRDESDAHVYAFGPGTIIPADGYLLLCENRIAFTALFPGTDPAPGDLGFGLSGAGELLRLFDAGGALHDSLVYDDLPPWPIEPDGGGPSLELIHPERDNGQGVNWAASDVTAPNGTPGAMNSVFDATAAPETPPATLRLAAPYPNPFNPATRLSFQLPETGRVRLTIHDVRGRELTRLVDERLDAGIHGMTWRGTDDHGNELASGLYLLRLQSVGETRTRKLVLLR